MSFCMLIHMNVIFFINKSSAHSLLLLLYFSFSALPSYALNTSGVGSNTGGGGADSLSPTIHAAGTAPGWPATTQPSAPAQTTLANGSTVPGPRSARVLYDYDAADIKELSLIADEVTTQRTC